MRLLVNWRRLLLKKAARVEARATEYAQIVQHTCLNKYDSHVLRSSSARLLSLSLIVGVDTKYEVAREHPLRRCV